LIPESVAGRNKIFASPGGYAVNGDMDLVVSPAIVWPFISAFFGTLTGFSANASGDTYQHLYTPTGNANPTYFTLDINNDLNDAVVGNPTGRRLLGVGVNSLTFEATAGNLATMTANVIAQKDKLVSMSGITPTYSIISPFSFTDGAVQIGGTTYGCVEGVRITFENNIPNDNFCLGSRFLNALWNQNLNITGSFDISFDTWAEYKRFFGGTAGTSAEPQATNYEGSLVITFTGVPTTGGVGAGFTNYAMIINLPRIVYNTTGANLDRFNRIVQNVEFTALYSVSESAAAKVTIVNMTSSGW
jgi:hypothetical protein